MAVERSKQLLRAAYWLAPPLFCLALYWVGLKCWFLQDDFAWLYLNHETHTWPELLTALFRPRAQGTIRPLSERAFFMIFSALFGMDALPFRIWVFLTQFANIVLLCAITQRLTGSAAAGFLAPILWIANTGLVRVMTWTSAYNQALCGLFLLASFYLLLRHIETGRRRYWIAQWAAFLLGFGALELNLVYPALAAGYTLARARPYFRKTLWLFLPSAVYVAVHRWAAPLAGAGTYGMHFDWDIPRTLATYWSWALTAAYFEPAWVRWALASALTAGLLAFAAVRARRRDWLPVWMLAWALILLAPVLPLKAHITEYYLMLPTLGLAMLGGWGIASAWRGRWAVRLPALALAAGYLAVALPAARQTAQWHYYRSRMVRGMVRGVARAAELHPGKTILLTGMDNTLFWTGMFDKPFRLVGAEAVFLAPGAEAAVEPNPEYGEVSDYVLPPGLALAALERKRLVVLALAGDRVRDITRLYEQIGKTQWTREEPRQIDVAQPIFAAQLGPGWYPVQDGHRWIRKRAVVRLAGPRNPVEKLYITGYCHRLQVAGGPVKMAVSVDGRPLAPAVMSQPDSHFQFCFNLPPEAIGKPRIEVVIELDRTFRDPAENRQLGTIIQQIAIR